MKLLRRILRRRRAAPYTALVREILLARQYRAIADVEVTELFRAMNSAGAALVLRGESSTELDAFAKELGEQAARVREEER